jgi:3-phenylpropionate/trans-cinnamate dioxygenase ferredoxin reductase subunit
MPTDTMNDALAAGSSQNPDAQGEPESVVIIGAGHSGARAAAALRQRGFGGRLVMLGRETGLPYDRPPLSKAVLCGGMSVEECHLYEASFYQDNDIELMRETDVVRIDRDRRIVYDDRGQAIPYGHLILATGAEPRRLAIPGAELVGVNYLRSTEDALALREVIAAGGDIVVIGAGFIGLEVAASAVAQGCRVLVVEVASRALQRAVPDVVAQRIVDEHIRHGVSFKFQTNVTSIIGSETVEGVELSDGSASSCACVVAGIGVSPRMELAHAAGLHVANGIEVDANLRTSDERIYAIGDACSFPYGPDGAMLRLESWKSAEDQAQRVAASIMGEESSPAALPWFWTDQYELTMQVAGMPAHGTTGVIRDLGSGAMMYFSLDGLGQVVGVSAIGRLEQIARDLRMAQSLITKNIRVDAGRLADTGIRVRELIAAA